LLDTALAGELPGFSFLDLRTDVVERQRSLLARTP
jgi:hypothetical protein